MVGICFSPRLLNHGVGNWYEPLVTRGGITFPFTRGKPLVKGKVPCLRLILNGLGQSRPVVPGGARGAMAPPIFGRSVNPISTKGGRLCPPNNTGTPGFSDLPTDLKSHLHIFLE